MEDIQPNTAPSAAPESVSSGPVNDTTSAAPASPSPSRSRGGRGSRKSAAPATTDEKFTASMEQTYNRIQGAGDTSQAVVQPNPAELYGQLDGTIDALTSDFANLPRETQEHLRKAIEPIEMPQAWGQDRAELWGKLDRSTQAYIAERELAATQKVTQQGHELAELRKAGGVGAELGSVIEKFSSVIPRGMDGNPMAAPEILAGLLNAHSALERNPIGALQWLARSYGIDPGHIGIQGGGQQQQQAQAQAQVQQLQHQLSQLQNQHQQWQQQRQGYFQREMESFIKERADYWSPELEDEVLRQVNAVRDTNPSVFNMDPLTVVRQAEARAKKIVGIQAKQDAVEAKKKADEAKRLASLNVRSVMGRSPSNVSGNMWSSDNWNALYDKASSR
jgi:hypothetical protein